MKNRNNNKTTERNFSMNRRENNYDDKLKNIDESLVPLIEQGTLWSPKELNIESKCTLRETVNHNNKSKRKSEINRLLRIYLNSTSQ